MISRKIAVQIVLLVSSAGDSDHTSHLFLLHACARYLLELLAHVAAGLLHAIFDLSRLDILYAGESQVRLREGG